MPGHIGIILFLLMIILVRRGSSHILDVIKFFFNEIINQFSITPKCLRANNALEFVQSGIQSYCVSFGAYPSNYLSSYFSTKWCD